MAEGEVISMTITTEMEKAIQDSVRFGRAQRDNVTSMKGVAKESTTMSSGLSKSQAAYLGVAKAADKAEMQIRETTAAQKAGQKAVTQNVNAWGQWTNRNKSAEKQLESFKSGFRGLAGTLSSQAVLIGDIVGSLGPLGVALAVAMGAMILWRKITNENKEAQEGLRKSLEATAKAAIKVREARQQAAASRFETQEQATQAVRSRLGVSTRQAEGLISGAAVGGGISPEQAAALITTAVERGITDLGQLGGLVGAAGTVAARTGQASQADAVLRRMIGQLERGRSAQEAAAIEERRVRAPSGLSARQMAAARAMAAERGISPSEAQREIYQEAVDRGDFLWMQGRPSGMDEGEQAGRRVRRLRSMAASEAFRQGDRIRRDAERAAEEEAGLASLGGTAEAGRAQADLAGAAAGNRFRVSTRRTGMVSAVTRHALEQRPDFNEFVGTEEEYQRAADDVATGASNQLTQQAVENARQALNAQPDPNRGL